MPSTFYGLDIANKGLFISQRQLNVTGHNISNVNTEGYSRQRLMQTAVDPGIGSKWAHVAQAQSGGGVRALTVDQIRDSFLDKQFRNENTRAQYWDSKYTALFYVEDVFNNLETGSMSDILSKFFGAVQELSKNSTDGAVRKNVTETAKSMIETFRSYYDQLKTLMIQQDEMLVAQTRRINDIGQQITELNENILKYELGGFPANDLRDKRNLLLDELSGLTGITYQEVPSGKKNINGQTLTKLEVQIGGAMFIDDNTYRALTVKQDTVNQLILDAYGGNPALVPASEKLHTVVFADDDTPVNIQGGILNAYLDVRDGNTIGNQGIPYFKEQLDKLAKALAESFNGVHSAGWTMPYTDSGNVFHGSTTGIFFFDPAGLTIDTIDLSPDIKASVNNIAAAHRPVATDPVTGDFETGNNEIALSLVKLLNASDLPVIGGFGKYFNTFLAELASEVGHAKQADEQEFTLLYSLGEQRVSVSGVSMDEEMTSLIRFQQAYNAAARVITAMDEALDVLVNRTGRVGL